LLSTLRSPGRTDQTAKPDHQDWRSGGAFEQHAFAQAPVARIYYQNRLFMSVLLLVTVIYVI